MSKAPSMPMYWDAYIADTTHLTTEEHGAYMLLLGAMWRRDGTVPDCDKDVARIVGLTSAKWRKVKERLAGFLTIENGVITQKNLQKIWKNTQEKIQKNKQNGAKGGRPQDNKNKDLVIANGSVSDNPNKTIPEPEPEPEPYTKNKDNAPTTKGTSSDGEGDLFDLIFKTFPRNPSSNRSKAGKAVSSLSEIDQSALLDAAKRFAAWFPTDCKRRGEKPEDRLRYVPHLSTWVSSEAWREAEALPVENSGPTIAMVRLDRERDAELWKSCVTVMGKPPPTDGMEWSFKAEIVEQAKAHLSQTQAA